MEKKTVNQELKGSMTFPQQMKFERRRRGWSQARMASELGTTPNTVSLWERGLVLPSPYFQEKICQLFGMDATALGLVQLPFSVAVAAQEAHKSGEQNSSDAELARGFTETLSFSSPFPTTEEVPPPPQTVSLQAQAPVRQTPRRFWFLSLSIVIGAILALGGTLVGLQFNLTHHPAPSLTSTPAPGVPKGPTLYTTGAPGASNGASFCDGGNGQWENYNTLAMTCQPDEIILHNPQQALAGLFLVELPNHASYPSNYVVEIQLREDPFSQAGFGLYFHDQPANVEGAYPFFIHSDGSWASYVYDNQTGVPTRIGKGSTDVSVYTQLTLDVATNGSSYTFYVNGRQVGQVQDTTYLTGTAGIVVDPGGTVDVSSFALYALS